MLLLLYENDRTCKLILKIRIVKDYYKSQKKISLTIFLKYIIYICIFFHWKEDYEDMTSFLICCSQLRTQLENALREEKQVSIMFIVLYKCKILFTVNCDF